MKFLEKDLETIIYDACKTDAGRVGIYQRGLPITGGLHRQVGLGNAGIADLIEVDYMGLSKGKRIIELTIWELKQGVIGIEAVLQAYRYFVWLSNYYRCNWHSKADITFRCAFIGSDFTHEPGLTAMLLSHGFPVYTYEYGIDGIRFTEPALDFEVTGNPYCRHDKTTPTDILKATVCKGITIAYSSYNKPTL